MLSVREKRIIEIKGTIAYLKETLNDLLTKQGQLDELERAIIDEAIGQLREYEKELDQIERGE